MAAQRYDVDGRVVLVTGASRGIGWEIARRLHARGAHVSLVGLEPDLLDARVGLLGRERAAAFHADVTDRAALEASVTGTVARFGGIDVCVANAGIATVASVRSIDPEDFERVLDVNLVGVWRTVRACLPLVVERRGYVLAVSSLAAVLHAPLMAPYSAAKAGVEAFCDVLRGELRSTDTRVGCAYFGFVDTDMVRDVAEQPAARQARTMPRFVARPMPLARAGDVLERGIARRARTIYAPRWVGPALALRSVLQPALERASARS